MKQLFQIVAFIGMAFGAATVAAMARHQMVRADERQRLFLQGRVPSPRPDGFYPGWLDGIPIESFWKGKQFDAATETGINVFPSSDGGERLNRPFRTTAGPGLVDPEVQVLKIDYDLPAN